MSTDSFDNLLIAHISRTVAEQLPVEVSRQLEAVKPLPMWMTEMQLAEYWQLRNREGELTTESIRKWTNRPADKHPLPCGNMGDMRRYNREEVDQWAREEVGWQRKKRAERARSRGSHLKAVGE